MGNFDAASFPKPPRVPRPLPDPPTAGWWVNPGLDPRVVRYHDGQHWTDAISRLGLRGPGAVEESPLADPEPVASDETDSEIAALPDPPRFPLANNLDSPKAGWWSDPDYRLKGLKQIRYYDGKEWTEFVCELSLKGPGPIHRKARRG